ncbi:putative post-transcriptional gene silencing PAZ-Argonaute family protein [Helianthus annuus]|nr:hypothetical protein HanIR_Chr14g0704191 [Helianthus annuus]KAJ0854180.1 putative post-transcriptional gene silencing PAZ-Argonaute family protein [Helianthus annuus]
MKHSEAGPSKALPPPPPVVPPSFVPIKVSGSNRTPMARRGFGTKGQRIPLLTNHFNVKLSSTSDHFYQYSVAFSYEDGNPVDAKGVGRKVLDMVQNVYNSEMGGKGFAYDGEKTLFTVGALPGTKLEFPVLLENLSSNRTARGGISDEVDTKRSRRPPQSKSYTVKISYATKIPIQAIFNALQGQDSEQFSEAVRVLDVLLRQHAARQECLIVRQCFFRDDPKNYIGIGGGVLGCRGFHSSFRATQAGLSLNIDASTTMIVRPGKVVDFLLENQNVRNIREIDWIKAKRTLKSLRIKSFPSNREHKIIGLSVKTCGEQTFSLKQKNGDSPSDAVDITVYNYYAKHHRIEVNQSRDYPCLDVGKPKRPVYIPLELCELLPLQRYTKALSNLQRASLVEKSRQKPRERMNALMGALKQSNYGADPVINSTGITISTTFTQVEGRVLDPPKLKFGSGGDLVPRGGRWNFNNKTFVEPAKKITCWAIVNFSARCNIDGLRRDLRRCSEAKGMDLEDAYDVIEESPQFRRASATVRVDKMVENMRKALPGPPLFILCILPERKNSDIYGPWKRKCLVDLGSRTQCIAPMKINDQYLTNLLLKINAKMDGINSLLSMEHLHSIPLVSQAPTIIFGMDVSHGAPGRSDVPSIAAVVSSRNWPFISRYRASVRSQSSRVEMIDGLFKPVAPDQDEGMIRELLEDFYLSTPRLKPENVIIFRDGVSESQFNQVLNIELEQIMAACKFLDESWEPKFMVIVAQKTHHTKFFQTNSDYNVPPGTIVDNKVCHPKYNDFYLCAQNGPIGTTRPTHYHVLLDQIGFSADQLQELVHSLSYVYQRSTTAISVVAPICYAHLAAGQMAQFVKFEDMSDSASSHSGSAAAGAGGFNQLPKLHERTRNSMFFC